MRIEPNNMTDAEPRYQERIALARFIGRVRHLLAVLPEGTPYAEEVSQLCKEMYPKGVI